MVIMSPSTLHFFYPVNLSSTDKKHSPRSRPQNMINSAREYAFLSTTQQMTNYASVTPCHVRAHWRLERAPQTATRMQCHAQARQD